MPIRIPNDLPAAGVLQQENIFVMPQDRAVTQDIRPLEIVLLNLMPTKIATETQLSRLLGNTPLQVHLELMHMSSHKSKNISQEHLLAFYTTFDQVKGEFGEGIGAKSGFNKYYYDDPFSKSEKETILDALAQWIPKKGTENRDVSDGKM